MREIPLKSFYVGKPLVEEEVGNATHLEPKNDRDAHIELQVVGGGPVFLFRGSLSAQEIALLVHGASNHPHYLLAAVAGQAAHATLEANPGPLTVYADIESIGHLRLVGCD